jgi:hypothetical protein
LWYVCDIGEFGAPLQSQGVQLRPTELSQMLQGILVDFAVTEIKSLDSILLVVVHETIRHEKGSQIMPYNPHTF